MELTLEPDVQFLFAVSVAHFCKLTKVDSYPMWYCFASCRFRRFGGEKFSPAFRMYLDQPVVSKVEIRVSVDPQRRAMSFRTYYDSIEPRPRSAEQALLRDKEKLDHTFFGRWWITLTSLSEVRPMLPGLHGDALWINVSISSTWEMAFLMIVLPVKVKPPLLHWGL